VQYGPSGVNASGLTAAIGQIQFQSNGTWNSIPGASNTSGTIKAQSANNGTYAIGSTGSFTLTIAGGGSFAGAISPDGNTVLMVDLNNNGIGNNSGIFIAVHQ